MRKGDVQWWILETRKHPDAAQVAIQVLAKRITELDVENEHLRNELLRARQRGATEADSGQVKALRAKVEERPRGPSPTFDEFLDAYQAAYRAQVTDATYQSSYPQMRKVAKMLGETPMRQVGAIDAQDLIGRLSAAGPRGARMSPNTVRCYLARLGSLWDAAEWTQEYSLFHHFNPTEILNGDLQPIDLVICAAAAIVPVVYALVVFPRRDLAAPA